MRTYQSETKDKKGKNGKKIAYSVLISLGVIIIATVITLSLTLGKSPVAETPGPGGDGPVVVPPVQKVYEAPVSSYTLGKMASLDRVVYSSSMNHWRTHNGIDFHAEAGTDALSVSDGTVTNVQKTVLDATVVTIDHGNGLFAYYKGLAAGASVKIGDSVEAGTVIGKIAAVMPLERDEGAHLHLEMKVNGKFTDPALYLTDLGEK